MFRSSLLRMASQHVEEKQDESFFSSFLKGKVKDEDQDGFFFQVSNPMLDADYGISKYDISKAAMPAGFDDDYAPGRVPSSGPRPPEGFSLDFGDMDDIETKQQDSPAGGTWTEIPTAPAGFLDSNEALPKAGKAPNGTGKVKAPSGFFSSDSSDDGNLDDLHNHRRDSTEESVPPPLPPSLSQFFANGVAGVSKHPQAEEKHSDDLKNAFEYPKIASPHQHGQAPELPRRKSKKTEQPAAVNVAAPVPELPPRRLKKTESTQSTTSQLVTGPVLKKTESAQSVTQPPEGKEPMKRRRTSFLEMLLRQKQEQGEFDPTTYVEATPVLLPEEERETGMTKQEIEEKIKRIAQASAAGHNTTAMGIGLRDIGYAVAKSRGDVDEDKRINVKNIARQAEELVVRHASSSQSQSAYTNNNRTSAQSHAGGGHKQGNHVRQASSSASTASNAAPIVMGMHPQMQKAAMGFDPIGEVSEGAYSQDSFRTDDTGARFKMKQLAAKESLQATGKGMKAKTDRFFGSMRLSFQQNAKQVRVQGGKSHKVKETLQHLKEKAGEVAEKVKVAAIVLKEKALIKKDEVKTLIISVQHRRGGGRG